MTERFTHGKPRTETPRAKDTPHLRTVRQPSDGRGEAGRFATGNQVATGRGVKRLIRESLTDPNSPIAHDTELMFKGLLKASPSDDPDVRQLLASQARHAVLATFYAREAAKAGLASETGMAFAEAAQRHDTAAQRFSVTAYDRAVRRANAKPKQNRTLAVLEDIRNRGSRGAR